MLTNEDKKEMEKMLKEAFPRYDENEINKMLSQLLDQGNEIVPFCTMNGNHIARIGVRYQEGVAVVRYYYATEYDNDFLDI